MNRCKPRQNKRKWNGDKEIIHISCINYFKICLNWCNWFILGQFDAYSLSLNGLKNKVVIPLARTISILLRDNIWWWNSLSYISIQINLIIRNLLTELFYPFSCWHAKEWHYTSLPWSVVETDSLKKPREKLDSLFLSIFVFQNYFIKEKRKTKIYWQLIANLSFCQFLFTELNCCPFNYE